MATVMERSPVDWGTLPAIGSLRTQCFSVQWTGKGRVLQTAKKEGCREQRKKYAMSNGETRRKGKEREMKSKIKLQANDKE